MPSPHPLHDRPSRSRNARLALVVTVPFALALIGAGVATTANAGTSTSTLSSSTGNRSESVTLCHATASVKNPYVKLTVSAKNTSTLVAGVREMGHLRHTGTAFTPGVTKAGDKWGDIIPVIKNAAGDVVYAGLNTDSLSWIARDCQLVAASATATSSASSTATATATPSTSPTNSANARTKVTLCHATGSVKNPYVKLTVSAPAMSSLMTGLRETGHLRHTGTAFTPGVTKSGDKWGDIIPVIKNAAGSVVYAGLNTDSLSWIARDCKLVATSASPSATS